MHRHKPSHNSVMDDTTHEPLYVLFVLAVLNLFSRETANLSIFELSVPNPCSGNLS